VETLKILRPQEVNKK